MVSTLIMVAAITPGDVLIQLITLAFMPVIVVFTFSTLIRLKRNWRGLLGGIGMTIMALATLIYASSELWHDLLQVEDDPVFGIRQLAGAIVVGLLLIVIATFPLLFPIVFRPTKKKQD